MSSETPRNPIQVVLNAKHYVEDQEGGGGGPNTDFFGNNDSGFRQHRQNLLTQVSSIKEVIDSSPYGRTAYVKVNLRPAALAKSHRPTQKLFRYENFKPSGADGIGELYFEVSTASVPLLTATIANAEPETITKINRKTKKEEFAPSRERSEIGAIDQILLPDEDDRRTFSTEDALNWFADERAGNLYLLDLFNLPASRGAMLLMPENTQKLYENLIALLDQLPFGVLLFRNPLATSQNHNYLFVRPIRERHPLTVADLFNPDTDSTADDFDPTTAHNEMLLRLLSRHPLVRRVLLPPIIEHASASIPGQPNGAGSPATSIPTRTEGFRYPKVGVVDGGIAAYLSPWILSSAATISASHRNESHATFIAGLLVAARHVGNPSSVALESDGCELVDLDLMPDLAIAGSFRSYYKNGFMDFLAELDLAIGTAKRKHGVRVFNLSINLKQSVDDGRYGPPAEILDAICEKHDVIIVNSAGNLKLGEFRATWPASPADVAAHLLPHAAYDRILQPSESVHTISVGAINPPGVPDQPHGAPTRYTRRGPGMRVGVKPDFAHFGGALGANPKVTGLSSLDISGKVIQDMGTSFAAPLVAKTLATLESRIQGHVSRQTLMALLVHKASAPDILQHDELATVARNFVGFGVPPSSDEILFSDDSAITMVFDSVLTRRRELRFDFAWPASMTTPEGKCRGKALLTLAYKPPLDANYGAEFVRLNLDGHLQQHIGNGYYRSKSTQLFTKPKKKDSLFEADLIEHGLKWWPIKHYVFRAPKGVGKSSQWRLHVEPLLRDGASFPQDGVPFTAILTIADTDHANPLFEEMRLWLNDHQVQISDIRTATRIRPTQSGGTV